MLGNLTAATLVYNPSYAESLGVTSLVPALRTSS